MTNEEHIMLEEKWIESVKTKRLKQCPLCGWKRIEFDISGEIDTFVIKCPCCQIMMTGGTLMHCRKRWNDRQNEHCYNDLATTLLMENENIEFQTN